MNYFMPCPDCSNIHIVRAGTYHTKTGRFRQRLRCKSCHKIFIFDPIKFNKKIPLDIRNKILELYQTKKPRTNKFDPYKKKTYSTREIARKLNVGKSFVHDVIKNGM